MTPLPTPLPTPGRAQLQYQSLLPANAAQAFAWHASLGAFARLTPPWEAIEMLALPQGLHHSVAAFRIPLGGPLLQAVLGPFLKQWAAFNLKLTWVAWHHHTVPNQQFVDTQLTGPMAHWSHLHHLQPGDDPHTNTSVLSDTIAYSLPLHPLARCLGGTWLIAQKMRRLFAFRHPRTAADLTLHQAAGQRGFFDAPQHVALLGEPTNRLVQAFAALLSTAGCTVSVWHPGNEPHCPQEDPPVFPFLRPRWGDALPPEVAPPTVWVDFRPWQSALGMEAPTEGPTEGLEEQEPLPPLLPLAFEKQTPLVRLTGAWHGEAPTMPYATTPTLLSRVELPHLLDAQLPPLSTLWPVALFTGLPKAGGGEAPQAIVAWATVEQALAVLYAAVVEAALPAGAAGSPQAFAGGRYRFASLQHNTWQQLELALARVWGVPRWPWSPRLMGGLVPKGWQRWLAWLSQQGPEAPQPLPLVMPLPALAEEKQEPLEPLLRGLFGLWGWKDALIARLF